MAWSLFMMLAVMALIPAVLWVVKRMQTIRPAGQPRQMELIAQLPLGTRERVVMVRVQDRVLVLGATAQQVTLLGEADASALPPASAAMPVPQGFANVLAALQKRNGTPGDRK